MRPTGLTFDPPLFSPFSLIFVCHHLFFLPWIFLTMSSNAKCGAWGHVTKTCELLRCYSSKDGKHCKRWQIPLMKDKINSAISSFLNPSKKLQSVRNGHAITRDGREVRKTARTLIWPCFYEFWKILLWLSFSKILC